MPLRLTCRFRSLAAALLLAVATLAATSAHAQTGSDTVVVFGPKRVATDGGRASLYVERFAATPSVLPHLLRVRTAPGETQPSRVEVKLNGAGLLSASDSRDGLIEVPVVLQADNTLEVTVQGGAGAVEVTVVAPADGSFAVLQPRKFERRNGGPQVETARFAVAASAGTPYRLHIINGEADGSLRVSSAVVRVNGAPLIGPSDLNQQVGGMVRQVSLGRDNLLEVEVRSAPGSFLMLWVLATDTTPPLLLINAPANDLITRESEVDASGRVLDETATTVTINAVATERNGDAFRARVPLAAEGANLLVFTATDGAGLRTDSVWTVIRDTEPPALTMSTPAEGAAIRDSTVRVSGTVRDRTAVTANVNGVPVTADESGAFSVDVPVPAEGVHFITLAATDAAGNAASLARQITRDTEPPLLGFTAPAEGLVTRDVQVEVTGTVSDASAVTVRVNGVEMLVEGGSFRGTISLEREGTQALSAVATDAAGNEARVERLVVRDTTAPSLVMEAPAEGLVTREREIQVTGTVADSTAVALTLNGAVVTVGADGRFTASTALAAEGDNILSLIATDAAGNSTRIGRSLVRDTEAPAVTITTPAPGALTSGGTVLVSGTVADRTAVTVSVNGAAAAVTDGAFVAEVALGAEGVNAIAVVATDAAGNEGVGTTEIVRDSEAPRIVVAAPTDGLATRDSLVAVAGRVEDASAVTLTLNGAPVTLGEENAFQSTFALVVGVNPVALAATDAAGNTSSVLLTVTREQAPTGPRLPPDPATVAPVLNRTVATTVDRAAEFLYTGASPIQTGVAPGTIEPVRTALVRGRVLSRDMQPLGGVTVRIRRHPELGQTLTRADGAYDLVVNGGGPLQVDFSRDGYLPAQRSVDVPWQSYTAVDDVILLQPDGQATVVTLGSPEVQVARGSPVQDGDGPRQATVIISAGTTAAIRLPDGTAQPVGTLTVRATEFTVGDEGVEAMPADLPPTSAYTYAVALTADEATRAGGTVEFSEPVSLYVENFMGFPVGGPVPNGEWDPEASAWIPQPNGRVIQVLAGGVDITGDGRPDADGALAGIGISPGEREVLAATYAPGVSLWRAPVQRFRIFDTNWGGRLAGVDPNARTLSCGSPEPAVAIECDAQVTRTGVGITGTPYALAYSSDRVPGRDQPLIVQLTGDSIRADLIRVELEITVAGRTFHDTLAAAPNLTYRFEWDGKDAYGRALQGTQPATVRVSHIYPMVYMQPDDRVRAFGWPCTREGGVAQCTIPSDAGVTRGRREAPRTQTLYTGVGTYGTPEQQMGGWTLTPHHALDPFSRTLFRGDGTRHAASGAFQQQLSPVAKVSNTRAMTLGPRGEVYVGTHGGIFRRDPDGTQARIAGDGGWGFAGDSVPALQARFGNIWDLELGPDGSLYIADATNRRIRRLGTDGIVTTVAGTGAECSTSTFNCGDGGPATAARFVHPAEIAFGPDGSLYVYDRDRIRRITPDGIIRTAVGGGIWTLCGVWSSVDRPCGDDGPATSAVIYGVPTESAGLDIGPDGSIYFGEDNGRVRRVTPDGVVRSIVGGPGKQALPYFIDGLDVAPNGSVYVISNESLGGSRLHRVDPNGTVRLVMGRGIENRAQVVVGNPGGLNEVKLAPDGGIYLAIGTVNYCCETIIKLSAPVPGVPEALRARSTRAEGLLIASESGSELYDFDRTGRHLRTLDAVTGDTLYSFGYDDSGLLASVTDQNRLITRIERGIDGTAVAVVGPYGQSTGLTPGADGTISMITGPHGQQIRLAYADGGLLSGQTDPNGHITDHRYDSDGRLVLTTLPDGNSLRLERGAGSDDDELAGISSMGLRSLLTYETLSNGGSRQTADMPGGETGSVVTTPDGRSVTNLPDGTVTTLQERPDPRYGMQAPLREHSARLPSGLTRTVNIERSLTFADPAQPTSLLTRTDRVTINGLTTTQVYDRARNTVTATSVMGRQAVAILDAGGRVVEQRFPGFAPILGTYDTHGRLEEVKLGRRAVRYTYDAGGRVESVTTGPGRTTRYQYNSAGQIETLTFAGGRSITYGHDDAGNVTSVTPPGRQEHAFEFTPTKQISDYVPPSTGGSASTQLGYDLDGRLESITRPGGVRIGLLYGPDGRNSHILIPGDTVRLTYTTAGYLDTAYGPDASVRYSYDGPLVTSITWGGAFSATLGFGYDSEFRIVSQTVNGVDTVGYRYDADGFMVGAGRLRMVRDPQSGVITTTALGGISTGERIDQEGSLERFESAFGATKLFAAVYTRDALGRIESVTESLPGGSSTLGFVYDSAGRLEHVRRDGSIVTSYAYDDNGNRSRTTNSTGVVVAEFDALDRLIRHGDATYGYTSAGELESRSVGSDTTRYRYDALGSLREVILPDSTRIEYLVDGDNHRVGKRVNGRMVQGFVWHDDLRIAAELDAEGRIVSRFVYGERPNVPEYMIRGGRTYRFVHDHAGSVRMVVDAETGEVAQQIQYDAFGIILMNSAPGFQPFAFAGGLADEHTGFVRFGARDYDPRSGRFTTKDPLLFDGGDTNLYSYALQDPINFDDPAGLSPYFIGGLRANSELRRQEIAKTPLYRAILKNVAKKALCISLELVTEEIAIESVVYVVTDITMNVDYAGRTEQDLSRRLGRHHHQIEKLRYRLLPEVTDIFTHKDLEASVIAKRAERALGRAGIRNLSGAAAIAAARGSLIANKIAAAGGTIFPFCREAKR